MALRLFIGSANAGKTGVLHAHLREGVRGGGAAVLLLPSAPDVARDLRELAEDVPVGLTVSTFDAYLDRLWDAARTGRTLISPARRLLVLEDIVSSRPLHDLAPSAATPGFLGALAHLVERGTEAGAATDTQGPASGVGGEIAALLAVYHDRLLAEGLVERAEAHRVLARRPELWYAPRAVAVNRFTSFTPAQEAFVVALASRCEVSVALTFDERVPATHAARAQVLRLSAIGEPVVVTPERRHSSSAELVRIERSFGLPVSDDDDGVEAEGAVVLSEAWGGPAEAARIVREVQDALESGLPAGTIAIAFRDPARHLRALRRALAEAGLDADWDVRMRFDATRLGRAVLLLLAYQTSASRTGDALDVLRSPFAASSPDALDALDVRLRSTRVTDARTFERMLRDADPDAAGLLAEARTATRALGTDAAEARWWRLLGGMMGRARGGAPVLDVDGLLDAAAARAVLGCVADMGRPGTAGVSPGVLAAALKATTVAVGSANRSDVVQVMSAERLRGRRYRCVILGGLVAGEFPRQTREDAFGSPAIRRDLATAGIEVPDGGTLEDERLMFYQAVTRASDRLVLSWQSHDADGRPQRTSLFVEELLDLYRRPDDFAWRRGEPPRHALGLDEDEADEWAPHSERRALRAAARDPHSSMRGSAGVRLAHARYRARTHPERLGPTALAELARRETFSVTDIETYLACPYRWYVQRIVRPSGIDREIDAAATGRLAHDILRDTYDRFVAETGCERVDDTSLKQALAIHRAVAAEAVARTRAANIAEQAAIRTVARQTASVLEADARLTPGFAPRYREWSFGMDGDPPEVLGTFALAGRIDRLDVDARRLIVTDYKTGRVTSTRSHNAFAAQGIVQAPLYAAVAARRLGLEPVAAVYRSIKGDRPRGFVREDVFADSPSFVKTDRVTAEEVDVLIAEAIARSEEAVAGMRAGEVPARPRNDRCPDFCPARAFCSRQGGGHARAR